MSLKEIRKRKGMKQSDLAKATGLSSFTISHFETGEKNINTAQIDTLAKISEVLECSIVDLLTDERLISMIKNNKIKNN